LAQKHGKATKKAPIMEINFVDPGQVPKPRTEMQIEDIRATPYPDGFRVKLNVDVTAFQERPNLEVRLLSQPDGKLVAHLSIIETMHRQMEFTLHIRGRQNPAGEYAAEVDLYYENRLQPYQTRLLRFNIPEGKEEDHGNR
jgi:hypothetical protein